MTTSKPDWFFPPLSGGEERGLNDAGIESFKRGEGLAREVVQNCLDNRDGSGRAAVVTFEYQEIPLAEFPGADRFRRVFEACRNHVLGHYGGDKTTGNENHFFEQGLALLDPDGTVPTLRIGDENTTGLTGQDDERNQPFWRLIRGQGYSAMQGPGGGTYGIGQRAPFAHSDLRTILYSTRLADGQVAFVAKTILATFKDPDHEGRTTQNTGWWCIAPEPSANNWATVRDHELIPDRYLRDTVGTDIHVMGYSRADWQDQVRWSVLQNFFAALAQGDLCVRLKEEGRLIDEFNKDNLDRKMVEVCNDAKEKQLAEEYRQGLKASLYFHRALTQPVNGRPFEQEIDKLGTVKLFVHQDPDAPDRWATMRSPRILVENRGSKIIRGYAAVFLCDTDEGNKYLASLEDPTHSKWHEDQVRGWTDEEKKAAREVRLAISRFVTETLKSLRKVDDRGTYDIPDLGRYLPLELDPSELDPSEMKAGAARESTGERTDTETGYHRSKDDPGPIVKRKLTPLPSPGPEQREQPAWPTILPTEGDGEDDDGPDTYAHGDDEWNGDQGGDPPPPTPGGGDDQGVAPGDGDEIILSPQDIRFRSFSLGGERYRIILESPEPLEGSIRLTSVGEDNTSYAPGIISAEVDQESLTVIDDRIQGVKLEAGVRMKLDVQLDTDIPISLAMRN